MQWAIRCMEPWARYDLAEAKRLGADSSKEMQVMSRILALYL